MSTTINNSPHKIDSLAGKALILGFGVFLGAIYITNLTPYSDFAHAFLFGDRAAAGVLLNLPLLGDLIASMSRPIATLIAAFVFAAIQVGEVWGLLLVMRDRTKVSPTQLSAALILSLLCFAIDLVAILNFFPPVAVPLGQFLQAGLFSHILWSELIIGLIILFGGCIYAWIWQLVRRLA